MRNRELSVITTVRADVLNGEDQIHPLATGNWVGGRTGVSQLLDRTDYMATLSHLRRVISPSVQVSAPFRGQGSACYPMGQDLSQRDAGRTQLRPGEELSAQAVELSKGVDDYEDIKRMLMDLGVVAG